MPSYERPLISIVIPTRNRWNLLRQLLRSICLSSNINLKKAAEVIIIDDSSTIDMPIDILKFRDKFYRFIIFRSQRRLGASTARNIGLLISQGRYILFVDDDAILPPHFINSFINLLNNNNDIAMAGGIIRYLKNPSKIQYVAWRVNLSSRAFIFGNITYESVTSLDNLGLLDADYIPTAFLVRREIAMKIRGFDTNIPLYYDDADFGYRIKKIGLKIIINPQISVYHNSDLAIFFNPIKTYMYIRNSTIFMIKHSKLHKITIAFGICVLSIRCFFQILKYSKELKFHTIILNFLYIMRGLVESVIITFIT